MNLQQLESQIAALEQRLEGIARPTGTIRALLDRQLREAEAKVLSAWEQSHPTDAAEWTNLHRQLSALELQRDQIRIVNAEALRALTVVGRLAGARVEAALRQPMPVAPPAMASARDWWDSSSWCCVLTGGVGVGKSVAAGWCVQQALAMRGSARWLSCPTVADGQLFGPEADAMRRAARSVTLLVLDDVGAERPSEPWISFLGEVLMARHADGARTVLTTNLALDALATRLGERLWSRVNEGGRQFKCGNASLRQRRSA